MKPQFSRAAMVGIAALVLPWSSLSSIRAAEQPAGATGSAGDQMPSHRGKLDARLSFFKQKLSLSDDQVAQMKSILLDQKTQLEAIRKDSTLSAEQKKAKAREVFAAIRSKVDAILTPDQKAKLDDMRKNSAEKRKEKKANS